MFVADTPFGFTHRQYRCPLADVDWPYHSAVMLNSAMPQRNVFGDYSCARCKVRIYPDAQRKIPFALGFVVREEWL